MQRLDAPDVQRLVDAVTEIGSLSADLPFPPETIKLLGDLIPADSVEYCELDRVERRYLLIVNRKGVAAGCSDEAIATYWRFEPHIPTDTYQRSGGFDATRISDLLTKREFHRLEVYSDYFHPCPVEYSMQLGLPAPLSHSKTFVFDTRAHDFSERDRLLLNLLQPHLIRRYARWKLQQRAAAGLAAIAESGADPAVLILGPEGRIEFAQRTVRRLLNDYFGEGDRSVAPVSLREWAADRAQSEDLVVDGREGQLVVSVAVRDESAQMVLLLHERHSEPPRTRRLTPRERDVLELVGEGKSNAEIGRLLWLQPSTIRKHLENAYPKLNVRSRTEATALLRREATRSDLVSGTTAKTRQGPDADAR